MAETFPNTIKPTTSSNRTNSPRTKSIAFGNGYMQITSDGINNNLEKWSLTFILEDADKQIVEDFFTTAGGINYFNWTSPELDAIRKQYLCPQWQINPLGSNVYQITCTFNEWAGLV